MEINKLPNELIFEILKEADYKTCETIRQVNEFFFIWYLKFQLSYLVYTTFFYSFKS